MNSAVGFTLIYKDVPNQEGALSAQQRAVANFPELDCLSIRLGESRLELWGRNGLGECIYLHPDGSTLVLVGSPVGRYSWPEIVEQLDQAPQAGDFEMPWDGRVVLLKISPDGSRWDLWNDWLGSIPVFHTEMPGGRIASTLEPVVVAAAGFTPEDFYLPGLVSLLIHGNYLSDWTLFKDMKVVPPDCLAQWDGRGYRWKQYFTVEPTDERWECGWDELVDEMYALSRQAIREALDTQAEWILPLSSGLDSRLIAGVAAELGVEVRAYTFGAPKTQDVVYARQIAHSLGLPWERVELGRDYLEKHTRLWADLFGSAMHFHGMHQIPFYETLKFRAHAPIVSGYVGDVLSGDGLLDTIPAHLSPPSYQIFTDGWIFWFPKEIKSLVKVDTTSALEEIAAEIQREIDAVPGAWYQKLRMLQLWSRQHYFTYYQSMLCDYWCGVATPYLNRDYARFCLSLPRLVLEQRRLLGEVYRRYYPQLAAIPGSYGRAPYYPSVRYILKRLVARLLPNKILRRPFQLINTRRFVPDVDSLRSSGRNSLWPLDEVWDSLEKWIDMNQIETAYEAAINGDLRSVRRLQSLQALAYRFLGH